MAEKVALITGAGKRMGRAIALRLARDGFAVALHYHSSHGEAAQVGREIAAAGGDVSLVEADLADPASPDQMIAASVKALGRLDLLVNNAAIFVGDSMAALDLALWRRQFAINLEAPVFLAAAFARSLSARDEGAIVHSHSAASNDGSSWRTCTRPTIVRAVASVMT